MSLSKILLTLTLLIFISPQFLSAKEILVKVSGMVTDHTQQCIEYAYVQLEGTQYMVITNETGEYEIQAPAGKYNLIVTASGHKTIAQTIILKVGEDLTVNLKAEAEASALNEVVITGKSNVQKINQSAYNVVAIDTRKLHNTTLDISHALDRISGVRIRESGGLGSQSSFSLNGFTGRQVRFFIDGVPMESFGSSFQINNIPINLAERIEVYKGVVPISFGADALGGAVNIVTTKQTGKYLDASYSYGSFNTHKSYINMGYTAKSGFTVQLNAYQNYSDNDYQITTDVVNLQTGVHSDETKVKRFHDTYHNETAIFNIGIVGKKYADRLLVGVILGKNKADIQTGARMREFVYGMRFKQGSTVMPTLQYSKKDLGLKGLDVVLTGNFNFGYDQVVDTAARQYNWLGEYITKPHPGSERTRTMEKSKDNLGVFTGNINYRIGSKHIFSLNNVFNTADRKTKNEIDPVNKKYQQPKILNKNIIGLGYKFDYSDAWSTSIFAKQYHQKTTYSKQETGPGGWGDYIYIETDNFHDIWGYGIASTYFLNNDLQFKASFEKGIRMPDHSELFGREGDNLEGNPTLDPETSYNVNLGITYSTKFNAAHGLIFDGAFLYRDTRDFIKTKLNDNQTHMVTENIGKVKNTGFNGEVRYTYKKLLETSLNMTYQNLRDDSKYETNEGVQKENTTYKDRVPNMPYLFGNLGCDLHLHNLIKKGNTLNISYNILYVHEYYLRWPADGQSSSKDNIPSQLTNDISATYSMKNGRYNVSLECRNIFNEDVYDNFSLQKPGRSFAAKFRYFINSH